VRSLTKSSVEPSQQTHELRLRLDRHDARPEPPPTAHAIAGMSADVEAQRVARHELRVEAA
jgi:hypothetical protein